MKKLVYLLIALLVTTGCSAEYSLTINGSNVTENLNLVYDEDKEYNTQSETTIQDYFYMFGSEKYPLYNDVRIDADGNFPTGTKYYDIDLVENNYLTAIGNTNISSLSKSNLINSCFNYFSVSRDENYYTLSTEKDIICFEDFNLLEDITVNITTDNRVIYDDADEFDEETNTYKWHFTQSNYKNKTLKLIYSNDYEIEEENINDDTDNENDGSSNSGDSAFGENNIIENPAIIGIIVVLFFIIVLITLIIVKKKKL